MSKLFQLAVSLADGFRDADHDTRPEMLQGLRDAVHPTCVYYQFLYRLVCECRPVDIIEIGTYAGVSSTHMAEPNYVPLYTGGALHGDVVTVDINPDAKRCVDELPSFEHKPHVVIGDSLAGPTLATVRGQIGKADVLYIDGQHTFARAYQEYATYRELVRDRGLIIIDDAGLEMDGDEMNVFWDAIGEPKHRTDWLHPNVGFGLVEKRDDVLMDVAKVLKRANQEIASRRKSRA